MNYDFKVTHQTTKRFAFIIYLYGHAFVAFFCYLQQFLRIVEWYQEILLLKRLWSRTSPAECFVVFAVVQIEICEGSGIMAELFQNPRSVFDTNLGPTCHKMLENLSFLQTFYSYSLSDCLSLDDRRIRSLSSFGEDKMVSVENLSKNWISVRITEIGSKHLWVWLRNSGTASGSEEMLWKWALHVSFMIVGPQVHPYSFALTLPVVR